jgi:hypothetical protein
MQDDLLPAGGNRSELAEPAYGDARAVVSAATVWETSATNAADPKAGAMEAFIVSTTSRSRNLPSFVKLLPSNTCMYYIYMRS